MRVKAFGAVFLILGIAFLVGAWVSERQERRVRDGAVRTTGTVVADVARGPLIRFTAPGGDRVSFTATTGKGRFAAGAEVPIYYHPDNPSFADLDDPRSRWTSTVIYAILAGVSLLSAALLLRS
jgi:hypothetical protein